jgi:hypothetical protein
MKKIEKAIKEILAQKFDALNFSCPISANNAFDCTSMTQPGITSRVLIYNFEDWKEGTITRAVDGTITAITNGSGLRAWDYSVADSGNVIPNIALRVVEGGADGYDHTVESKGFDVSQAGSAQISKMRFQKVVIIIERVDGTAKVYGEGIGMRLSDLQWNEGSSDLGGVIQFIAKTSSNDPPENELPVLIDAGSPAANKVILDSLTTPGA